RRFQHSELSSPGGHRHAQLTGSIGQRSDRNDRIRSWSNGWRQHHHQQRQQRVQRHIRHLQHQSRAHGDVRERGDEHYVRACRRAAEWLGQAVVPAQLRVNNVNRATSGTTNDMFGSYSWLESEDSDMVANHFPLDTNGDYYRAVDPGHNATLAYLGTSPSSYV